MDENIINNYLISIVVPCYNCQKTIRNTVDYLINQISDNDYQIVLVDDGSTDETPSICDCFAKTNSNIFVIHKKNGGLVDAWKEGVKESTGEYIAFCDSDDYIDTGFVQKMSIIIKNHNPDIIAFGMKTEYNNGEVVSNDILLPPGYYKRELIEKEIFPRLLSSGDMQSEIVGSSRCNKVFKKELLIKIIDDVPNSISFGEDDVTCFAAEINANSIYSLKEYYPYHYIRNSESMIGSYSNDTFNKIDFLYKVMKTISEKYSFMYPEQVEQNILSTMFLYIKKEICKCQKGKSFVVNRISEITKSETFIKCYKKEYILKYDFTKRMYANLIAKGYYKLVYFITRTFEKIRGRNV